MSVYLLLILALLSGSGLQAKPRQNIMALRHFW
jgi:hypothetical protein